MVKSVAAKNPTWLCESELPEQALWRTAGQAQSLPPGRWVEVGKVQKAPSTVTRLGGVPGCCGCSCRLGCASASVCFFCLRPVLCAVAECLPCSSQHGDARPSA